MIYDDFENDGKRIMYQPVLGRLAHNRHIRFIHRPRRQPQRPVIEYLYPGYFDDFIHGLYLRVG